MSVGRWYYILAPRISLGGRVLHHLVKHDQQDAHKYPGQGARTSIVIIPTLNWAASSPRDKCGNERG